MVKLKGRQDYPFYFGASTEILKHASNLRKSMTKAEKTLWSELRNRQLENFRFRRQHPIGKFVSDFFCYEAMLVIEIDGGVHDSPYQKERDNERTRILNDLGISELRFKNEEIFHNLAVVLEEIREFLIHN